MSVKKIYCGDEVDIEDCVSPGHVGPLDRLQAENKILPRALRRKLISADRPIADSFIPGTQSIYIKTWGCSHNNSDGEYMAGLLASNGYAITDSPLQADLWLLNSCTVKGPSEDSLKNSIRKGQELGKPLVVTGCVPQGQQKHSYIQGLSVVGVQQIDRVVEVVEETLQGRTVRLFGKRKFKGRKLGGAPLDMPKIRKNPLVEIVAISTGCLNQCTYCKTKHARGELGSYLPQEIVARAQQAFQEGVVEVWLTSEDLGAYGRDIGVSLPNLLWQLVNVIPEGCMLRLGMTNPPYILEHVEAMADILAHPRVYSFLHVPVQSGSDKVLNDMRREYTTGDFRELVNFLKEKVPGLNIATDIICGFPTESEEDFTETLELVKEYKFSSLFINQFYPRPGTPAARMHKLPTHEVKQRSRALSHLFQSYEPYTHKVGERQMVLATELSHDQLHYVAHNKFYEQVLVPKDPTLLGKMFEVVITSTGKHFLKGSVVKESLDHVVVRPPPLLAGDVSGMEVWKAKTLAVPIQQSFKGLGQWDIILLALAASLADHVNFDLIVSVMDVGEFDMEEDDKFPFPGLNKAHGFFSLIERNQRDRDCYHQEREEWKQARKLEVKKEWRNERESRRRPPLALYQPPHQRASKTAQKGRKFTLKVELQPKQWYTIVVECGKENAAMEKLKEQHPLSPVFRSALLDMMAEFSQKLLL